MPECELLCMGGIVGIRWRPLECLEKFSGCRIDLVWELNGEMGNSGGTKIRCGQRPKQPYKIARCPRCRLDKDVDIEFMPSCHLSVSCAIAEP